MSQINLVKHCLQHYIFGIDIWVGTQELGIIVNILYSSSIIETDTAKQ